MEIPQIGQIWQRLDLGDAIYFPPGGWKVEIMMADTLNVIHRVVEHDGIARNGTTYLSLETEDFLVMYVRVL